MHPIILVVESDQSFALFLKDILLDNNYEPVLEKTGISALSRIEEFKPDVIIANYYLPDIRGDEFYTSVQKIYPKLPIFFISEEANKNVISKVLSHRKADYMVKPVVMEELLARVDNILRKGKKNTSSNKIILRDLSLDLQTFTAKRGGKKIDLSPTEFELLKYLMINKNMVLTRGMILSKIWGYNSDVTSRVVDVYIGYLREKIGIEDGENMIETVRGFGYTIKD